MKNQKRLNPGAIAIIACTCILVLIFVIAYFRGLQQVDEEYERIKNEYYSNAQSNLQSALESMNAETDEPMAPTTAGTTLNITSNVTTTANDASATTVGPIATTPAITTTITETPVTSTAPVTTTKMPVTTTKVPLTTQRPVIATTQAPLTTQRPVIATQAPLTTKKPEATKAPVTTAPPAATAKPPISDTPNTIYKTYSGSGNKVITDVTIPEGLYKVTASHVGDGNFIVMSYDGDGELREVLANEIDNYSGSVLFGALTVEKSLTNGYFEVKAKGDWEIRIEAITERGTSNVEGAGDCVSPLFKLNEGAHVVKLNYTGDSNFVVFVFNEDGEICSVLVNEIGSYSGEALFSVRDPNKLYFIEVVTGVSFDGQGEGTWSVDFGIDSEVTHCDD